MATPFTDYVISICGGDPAAQAAFEAGEDSAVAAMTAAGLTAAQQDMLLRQDEDETNAAVAAECRLADVPAWKGGGNNVFIEIHIPPYE